MSLCTVRRVMLVVLAVGFGALALGLWQTRSLEQYLAVVWPPVMAVTAVGCLALAVSPGNLGLYRWTGALAVVSLGSRVAGVVLNVMYGEIYASPWRALIAGTLYLLAAYGMGALWYCDVGPWVGSEHHRGKR